MNNQLILVVEDHWQIRDLMEQYLSREGFRTSNASDGTQGLANFQMLKPDLVVLDIGLPRQDGFSVLNGIRHQSDTPVIVVTARDDPVDELQCFRLGADDYIIKPFRHPGVVVERVKATLRRCRIRGASRVMRFENLVVDLDAYTACVHHPTGVIKLSLTMTEYKLLARMAESPGRAIQRAEFIDACFTESGPLETTINTHMHNLRRKLGDTGAGVDVTPVRGIGYRLEKNDG
ncbi:response regulator transcription factor [Sinorhizobium meliloti]|uniref:response regulator transcription factor n=1 Tax=Rhizobium meliloti TaxID=382 RepID=UPI000FDBFE78|nr:response regulator transcription factor [Sinorhizobium meliloti]RVK25872.1 DNA-binding response regulator [Sinorhizobium meliloti]